MTDFLTAKRHATEFIEKNFGKCCLEVLDYHSTQKLPTDSAISSAMNIMSVMMDQTDDHSMDYYFKCCVDYTIDSALHKCGDSYEVD